MAKRKKKNTNNESRVFPLLVYKYFFENPKLNGQAFHEIFTAILESCDYDMTLVKIVLDLNGIDLNFGGTYSGLDELMIISNDWIKYKQEYKINGDFAYTIMNMQNSLDFDMSFLRNTPFRTFFLNLEDMDYYIHNGAKLYGAYVYSAASKILKEDFENLSILINDNMSDDELMMYKAKLKSIQNYWINGHPDFLGDYDNFEIVLLYQDIDNPNDIYSFEYFTAPYREKVENTNGYLASDFLKNSINSIKSKEFKEKDSQLLNLVVALVDYINSFKADVLPNQESEKYYKKSDKIKTTSVRKWDVGYRVIKEYNRRLSESINTNHTGTSKRPHIRKAHWHTYHKNREKVLLWIPPIFINCNNSEDLPVVAREI